MKLKEIIEVCNGKLICGDLNTEIKSFSKDTRTIKENDLYIGIKGENYDGNIFYLEAFSKGASTVILDNEDVITEKKNNIILVDNSIKALQQLAIYKRSLHNIPVIAITGSVGKTTTKDIIYNVLKDDYKILKTEKNFNSQIGLPLTILKLEDEDIILAEMGMNEKGGIDKLANILKPDILVITNIGSSHIGNLGSKEDILNAKLEALNHMKDGTLILNNDNDMLNQKIDELKKYKIITYGIDNLSDYKADDIKLTENSISYKVNDNYYEIPLLGRGNIYNSLVSIIIGNIFKIKNIDQKLKNIEVTNNRLNIIKTDKYKIIDDCYNASLESMMNAIEVLKNISGERKIAILGDMLELGEYSKQIHQELGDKIENIDILITIGKYSYYINEKANIKNKYHYETLEEGYKKLKDIINENDVILIKASNSMNFKYIVDKMINYNQYKFKL